MWDKNFRLVIISAIYQNFIEESIDIHDLIDWQFISDQCKLDCNNDFSSLETMYTIFLSRKAGLVNSIETLLPHWDRTFDIVKAILLSCLLEVEAVNCIEDNDKKKIISKHVNIAQEIVGGENPSLVYAVLRKLLAVSM